MNRLNSSMLRVVLCLCASAICSRSSAQDSFEEAAEEAAAEAEQAMTREQMEARTNELYFNGKFTVNDADPVASVPSAAEQNESPLDFGYFLTSLIEKGNTAVKRGDHAAAVKYFLALALGTPDGSLAHRRLCEEYRALGDQAQALKACGQALIRNGVTLDDYVQYVHLAVTQPSDLTAAQVSEVEKVIEHISSQAAPQILVQDLRCRLAARILDATRLQACTDELRKLQYPAQKMSTYVWALAVLRGDKTEAERQLQLAQQAGIDTQTLAGMTEAMDSPSESQLWMQRAALLLMAAIVFVFGFAYLQKWTTRRARA